MRLILRACSHLASPATPYFNLLAPGSYIRVITVVSLYQSHCIILVVLLFLLTFFTCAMCLVMHKIFFAYLVPQLVFAKTICRPLVHNSLAPTARLFQLAFYHQPGISTFSYFHRMNRRCASFLIFFLYPSAANTLFHSFPSRYYPSKIYFPCPYPFPGPSCPRGYIVVRFARFHFATGRGCKSLKSRPNAKA